MTNEFSNIATAMSAVMNDAGFVEMTGENAYQNYKYASELDLIAALRPAMIKHGVVAYPNNIEVVPTDNPTRTDAIVRYNFMHAASGEYISIEVLASGSDKTDKAAYKLMTGGLKYALRQAFLIPTGDDAEAYDDMGQTTAPPPPLSPIQKLIGYADARKIDVVKGQYFSLLWEELGIGNLSDLSSSPDDMKIVGAVKLAIKEIMNGKSEEDAVEVMRAKLAVK